MLMNKLLVTILLLTSIQTFAQFDYDLFKNYTAKTVQERNKKVSDVTEYQQEKKIWIKTSSQQFNLQGLPAILIQYDQQGKEAIKKEFVYDSAQCISQIETYKRENMKKRQSLK